MHTGGIDGMWEISKGAVSSSWSACCGDAVNPEFVQGIEFGNGDGTVEIAKISSVSNQPRWDTKSRGMKSNHHPRCTKPCKYRVVPSKSTTPQRQKSFFCQKCLIASPPAWMFMRLLEVAIYYHPWYDIQPRLFSQASPPNFQVPQPPSMRQVEGVMRGNVCGGRWGLDCKNGEGRMGIYHDITGP